MASIGGRIEREVLENALSAFRRRQAPLPNGTLGYQAVRPEREKVLTAMRRGECNALKTRAR